MWSGETNSKGVKTMSDLPKFKLRDGLLSVTVWENRTEENKVFYSTDIKRSYQQGEDWKETTSLNKSDLPKAAALLNLAYQKIIEADSETS